MSPAGGLRVDMFTRALHRHSAAAPLKTIQRPRDLGEQDSRKAAKHRGHEVSSSAAHTLTRSSVMPFGIACLMTVCNSVAAEE